MKIAFLPPAKDELVEATAYYNAQSEGDGHVVQYPDAWSKLSAGTRRCTTNRFPYGLICQAREETLLIVAVVHLGREPESWMSRLRTKEL